MEFARQLTIRGFDRDLALRVRQTASAQHISFNQAVLNLLRIGAGLGVERKAADTIGADLDRFFGTWSDEEARQVMDAVKDFETVDETLWR